MRVYSKIHSNLAVNAGRKIWKNGILPRYISGYVWAFPYPMKTWAFPIFSRDVEILVYSRNWSLINWPEKNLFSCYLWIAEDSKLKRDHCQIGILLQLQGRVRGIFTILSNTYGGTFLQKQLTDKNR